jgi:hypothetical protein
MPPTFGDCVDKLGFADPATWPGGEIDALITVRSVDQLKDLLDSGATEAEREAHVRAMFESIDAASEPDGGLLRRVHFYVYGNDPLSAEDRAAIEVAFPLQVRVITAVDKTIDSQWDLGTSVTPMVKVCLGTLTMNQGGYVSIENTMLDFRVDDLIRNGNAGPNIPGDFLILGVPGTRGRDGSSPPPPGQAQSGAPGECSSGGVSGHGGGNGSPGVAGTPGGGGEDGQDGLPSLSATIMINNSIGGTAPQIVIATQSGSGGAGGNGGNGSAGGQGGNGGNGVTCGCTGNAGGTGAQGGKGGSGGNGGNGGNGVDAQADVVVQAPAAFLDKITGVRTPAPPGLGGAAGLAGPGGAGGAGSTGGKDNPGGDPGGQGAAGDPATAGKAGTVTGQPAFVRIQPK